MISYGVLLPLCQFFATFFVWIQAFQIFTTAYFLLTRFFRQAFRLFKNFCSALMLKQEILCRLPIE